MSNRQMTVIVTVIDAPIKFDPANPPQLVFDGGESVSVEKLNEGLFTSEKIMVTVPEDADVAEYIYRNVNDLGNRSANFITYVQAEADRLAAHD